MNVYVTTHAIDRYIEYFEPKMSRSEVANFIRRTFKRGSVVCKYQLTEIRRKGRLYMVSSLQQGDKGGFTNRSILTLYKGAPKLRHQIDKEVVYEYFI